MWTEDIADFVATLWKKGLTATEIGEKIGKSRNAILGKLNRLGLVGDGSHRPGMSQHDARKANEARKAKSKVAPSAGAPGRSAAREAGRAAPLAVPPPPLLPLKPSLAGWIGIVAAVEALQNGKCRYPLPDGRERPNAFCMAPCGSREVYCTYHAMIAYRPPGSKPEPDDACDRPNRPWRF